MAAEQQYHDLRRALFPARVARPDPPPPPTNTVYTVPSSAGLGVYKNISRTSGRTMGGQHCRRDNALLPVLCVVSAGFQLVSAESLTTWP